MQCNSNGWILFCEIFDLGKLTLKKILIILGTRLEVNHLNCFKFKIPYSNYEFTNVIMKSTIKLSLYDTLVITFITEIKSLL